MIGDHYQLPPLVRSRRALSLGLGESLFAQLAEAHPEHLLLLNRQYRMNGPIQLVANTLIYKHALIAGGGIAQETARLSLKPCPDAPAWIQRSLEPSRAVVFINTDGDEECRETVDGASFYNGGEVKICEQLVSSMLEAGLIHTQLGIITPYRPQLQRLQAALPRGIEVSTVDRFQGRDRPCIILSLVRSAGHLGELLTDWRRLNVAMTRAKLKLILIGSASTILTSAPFAPLAQLIGEQGWQVNKK